MATAIIAPKIIKPRFGSPLNLSNPLTDRLVAAFALNEGGGMNIFNSAPCRTLPDGTRSPVSLAINTNAVASWAGNGIVNTADDPVISNIGPAFINSGSSFTVALKGYFPVTNYIFCLKVNGAGGGLRYNIDTISGLRQITNAGTWATGSTGSPNAAARSIIIVFDISLGDYQNQAAFSYYVDNLKYSLSGSVTAATLNENHLMGYGPTGYVSNLEHFYIWSRALTAGEINQIYHSPYAMYQTISSFDRIYGYGRRNKFYIEIEI